MRSFPDAEEDSAITDKTTAGLSVVLLLFLIIAALKRLGEDPNAMGSVAVENHPPPPTLTGAAAALQAHTERPVMDMVCQ